MNNIFIISLSVRIDPIESESFDSDFPQIFQQCLPPEIGLTNSLESEQKRCSKWSSACVLILYSNSRGGRKAEKLQPVPKSIIKKAFIYTLNGRLNGFPNCRGNT